MLCERLRALEEADIVVRKVSAEPPVRVDYELTDKGRALEPALKAIGRWAEKWVAAAPRQARRRETSAETPPARAAAGRRVTRGARFRRRVRFATSGRSDRPAASWRGTACRRRGSSPRRPPCAAARARPSTARLRFGVRVQRALEPDDRLLRRDPPAAAARRTARRRPSPDTAGRSASASAPAPRSRDPSPRTLPAAARATSISSAPSSMQHHRRLLAQPGDPVRRLDQLLELADCGVEALGVTELERAHARARTARRRCRTTPGPSSRPSARFR